MYDLKSSSDIAAENHATVDEVCYVVRFYKINHTLKAGKTRMFNAPQAEQIAHHLQRVRSKHLRNQKTHIVTPATDACFLVADHARWLGVSAERVDQAIAQLGIVPRGEFAGEFVYRAELADAVGRVALHLARQAGEAIQPDRSEPSPEPAEWVSSLQGVAMLTGKPLHEVANAARTVGAKPVRKHADGRELFNKDTEQAILNELSRRKVGQAKAA